MRRLMMLFLLALAPELALAQQRTYIPPQIGATPGSPGSFTLTGPLLLPDGTAATPSLYWSGSAQKPGFYRVGDTIAFAQGGIPTFTYGYNFSGAQIPSTGSYAWGASSAAGNGDLFLMRDAANTLALRNSGTAGVPVPQAFNVYNFCDGAACATGYERASFQWGYATPFDTSAAIVMQSAGTGSAKSFSIVATNINLRGSINPYDSDTYNVGRSNILYQTGYLSRSIQGSKTFALTDGAAAAAFVRIAVPQTVDSNFAGGDVIWTATAKDATPHVQALSGRLKFSAVNNAGTEVCAVDPTAAVTAPNANSSGTLSCTMSCASNAADTVDLMATCDTSLGTPTGLTLYYRLDMPKTQTITPQ